MRLQALAGLEFTACNAPPGRCRSADSASRAGRHFRSPRGHGFAGPSLALGRHKTAIRELPLSALSSHLGRPLRSGSGRSTFGNLDLAWSRDWAPVSGHWRGPAIDPVRTSARTDRLPESGPVPSRRAILNSGRTRLLQATTGSDLTIPDLRRAPQSMRPAPWQLKHLRTTAPQQGRGPVTFAATALRRAKVAALAN